MPLTDSKVNIDLYVNSKNTKLWQEITSDYNVRVEYSGNLEHGCYTRGNDAIIYVPKAPACPDSFTHELLHIYIRIRQVFIGVTLQAFTRNEKLSSIWSDKLVEHAGNCLDHIKMLPVYLNLGFKKEKFLFDYDKPKCTDNDLAQLKQLYRFNDQIVSGAAHIYIALFFGMKADPNDSFNYISYYEDMQELDQELYQLLEDFINSWIKYDIEVSSNGINSYHRIASDFENDLELWVDANDFIYIPIE